ncbi:MAG: glycosyltransferase family 2 protein [Candidatus Saccharimonadales bacterium]
MNETVVLILFTIAIVALIDFVPRLFVAKKKMPPVGPSYTRTPQYLIMPTVYGNISYLQNLDFLRRYADKVIICTSKYETKEFYKDLRRVCRDNGLRYACAELPIVKGKPVKNAYTIYRGILTSRQLRIPKDTPCLLIDADTYALENVNNLARAFKESTFDIASLRCEASRANKVIEKLQAFEYKLAMDNRNMDPWLTSGACNLGTVSALRRVFARHSKFFAGGDIEIGKLARIMGYRVGHLDFTFYTAVPDTIKDWYNQRIIWFAGGVRHHVANIASFGWYHFFMLFYNSLLIYLLFPLRWVELVNFPLTLVAAILISWIYTYILVFGRGWQNAYLLLPFYAFFQTMIILPVAIVRYSKLAWAQRSFGLLKHDLSHLSFFNKALYRSLNVGSAALIIYAAILFTSARLDYWVQNGAASKFVLSLFSALLP